MAWIRGDVTKGATVRAVGLIDSPGGTGADQGDGRKALKQADVSTITCEIIDAAGTLISSPTVDPSVSILDTPGSLDKHNYNFFYDFAAGAFPKADQHYDVIFKITTTGGDVAFAQFRPFVHDSEYQ